MIKLNPYSGNVNQSIRIAMELVIPGHHPDLSLMLHADLSRTQNMAGRVQTDGGFPKSKRFTIGNRAQRHVVR